MGELARVRLVVTDVDGVLTDGTVTVDSLGREACRYSKRDGVLLPVMREAGIQVVAMTSEQSSGLRIGDDGSIRDGFNVHQERCRKLGITLVTCNPANKLGALLAILDRRNGYEHSAESLSEVAYIGDDFPDLPCLEAVAEAGGAAFVPGGSPAWRVYDAKATAMGSVYVDDAGAVPVTDGGRGCLREVCEMLLKSRGYDLSRWPVVKR